MDELLQYKIFTAKYFGPIDTTGSRTQIKDLSTNKAKYLNYDYQFNNSAEQALNYLQSQGYQIIGYSHNTKNVTYIITEWDE